MGHDERARWCIAIVIALAQAGAWTRSLAYGGRVALAAAIVLQLGTVLFVRTVPRRRGLAAALCLTVPVVGPIAAMLAATVSGHGGRDLVRELHAETRRLDGHQVAHALAGALPACDAILSTDREVRRACLARLTRRAEASDIAILRWARAHARGEVAVEIALALEDVVMRFEDRVAAARAEVARIPGYAASAHALRVLAAGICSGIVDEPMMLQLAREAREHHEAAIAADAERARELLADRARLELAVDQPDTVLDLLEPHLGGDAELVELYKQAAYAARRFELAAEPTTRRSRARECV